MRIRIFKTPPPSIPPLAEWTDPHLGPHSLPLNYALALQPVQLEMRLLHRTFHLDVAHCVKREG